MPYSLLGFFAGFGIARSTNPPLDGAQAAKVAFVPGFLGLNIPSLLIAKVVADQEAESLRPVVAVEPPDHNYGEVDVDTPVSQTFVVSNIGTAELEVTRTEPDATGDFVIVSGEIVSGNPLKLPPGATHNITVTFTPTITGEQNANLLITSNDPDQPIANIILRGTGVAVAPAIAVTPDPLEYGSVNINSSASKILFVSNTGTANLDVRATTPSDLTQFTIGTGGAVAPFTVPPKETRFVEVSFKPALPEGEKIATLDITHNDPARGPVNITLKGTGIPPIQ